MILKGYVKVEVKYATYCIKYVMWQSSNPIIRLMNLCNLSLAACVFL